jgi:hypothetical protein
VVIVVATHSATPWHDARAFSQAYHAIQVFPHFAGFVLVTGYILIVACLYEIAKPRDKTSVMIAVFFTAVFSVFVFFNYVAQTTFVPKLTPVRICTHRV